MLPASLPWRCNVTRAVLLYASPDARISHPSSGQRLPCFYMWASSLATSLSLEASASATLWSLFRFAAGDNGLRLGR
jgi:hypothetical protein